MSPAARRDLKRNVDLLGVGVAGGIGFDRGVEESVVGEQPAYMLFGRLLFFGRIRLAQNQGRGGKAMAGAGRALGTPKLFPAPPPSSPGARPPPLPRPPPQRAPLYFT